VTEQGMEWEKKMAKGASFVSSLLLEQVNPITVLQHCYVAFSEGRLVQGLNAPSRRESECSQHLAQFFKTHWS